MASAPSIADRRITRPADVSLGPKLQTVLSSAIRFVAFWLAVALPFCHLALIVDGLAGNRSLVLVALLGVNVLALVAGHNYRR
ncbi:hypothetical protein AUR64_05475 [Haloprofundus marisrubri]|uniref:Uncharacterized protein n=1 Tax=Haloprofundus marisrubri TaxID=1514971 RepID=A0A0W1RCP1_9EURY|nr:hypothetical protein [Haloprofundus marisrubri]KTG11159.1 hypothetical protein AUR64_05475 [Haloprofundus marisrubri]